MGLKPENIAIEIIESDVEDLKELQRFVQLYRSYGFLIALDDVGAGHSNLNRIPLIKPDILKIDRFLVQNIQDDFYKQEVLEVPRADGPAFGDPHHRRRGVETQGRRQSACWTWMWT